MASQYSPDRQDNVSTGRLDKEKIRTRIIEIRDHLVTDLGTARKDIERLSIEARGTKYEEFAQNIDTNFMRFKLHEIHQTIDQFLGQ